MRGFAIFFILILMATESYADGWGDPDKAWGKSGRIRHFNRRNSYIGQSVNRKRSLYHFNRRNRYAGRSFKRKRSLYHFNRRGRYLGRSYLR